MDGSNANAQDRYTQGVDNSASNAGPNSSAGFFRLLQKISRAAWLTLSAAVLIAGSVVWHFSEPDWDAQRHQLPTVEISGGPLSWLKRRWTYGADAELPQVSGRLYGVAVQPRGSGKEKRLWVAGAHGFLAYSDNGGQCWTPYEYAPSVGQFREAKTNPCSPAQQAQSGWPDIVPVVFAASSQSQSSPEQTNPAPRARGSTTANAPAQSSSEKLAFVVFPARMDFGELNLPNPTSQKAPPASLPFTVTNNTDEIMQVAIGGFRGDGASEFRVNAGTPSLD